jgi:hypothetical protein
VANEEDDFDKDAFTAVDDAEIAYLENELKVMQTMRKDKLDVIAATRDQK